jgi:hypothetical protein
MGSGNEGRHAGEERKGHFSEHRRTLHCFVYGEFLRAPRRRPPHAINTNQNLIGLVNRNGVSIHHVANCAPFHPVAFIFGEQRLRMVNRWYAPSAPRLLDSVFKRSGCRFASRKRVTTRI